MKQFIRYLYEYEQGKRVRNIGFVKVEYQEKSCVIHLHGKGFGLISGENVALYLFYMQDKKCVGILQGTMEPTDLSIHYRLEYEPDDVCGAAIYEHIEGIVLKSSQQKCYAAVWNDMPVDVEHMILHEQLDEIQMEAATVEVVEEPETVEEKIAEEPTEQCIQESCQESHQELHQESIQEREQEPQDVDMEVAYKKIQRQDIAELPRSEWKLANNNFLLHGYHNYQHLLLIEHDGALFLGVPGIFHEREQTAARTFGFPQFHRLRGSNVQLSEKEMNVEEDFGYWCRQVQKPSTVKS